MARSMPLVADAPEHLMLAQVEAQVREMELLLADAQGLQDVHKAQVIPGA